MKKSVKKALSVLLCAALLFGAAPLNGFVGLHFPQFNLPKLSSLFATLARAEDNPTSGTCGANLTWSYDETTATLTISGTGAMNDYSFDKYYITTALWKPYYSTMQTLVINSGVTSIGYEAFRGCTGLTSVTIGNSVTSIGENAFRGCTGLTSVTIGNSVTSIGDYAFFNCTGLTSVIIPDSVTSIGMKAFCNCTGLTEINYNAANASDLSDSSNVFYNAGKNGGGITVTFGDSVKKIPTHLFDVSYSYSSYRPNITSVYIGNNVSSIGDYAFSCTGLTNVTIPDSVTSIGSSAFSRCIGLTSVTIPDSVTNIGNGTFYSCTGLTSVTIGNSVTSISYQAFYNCTGLTSVTIPDSVRSIGERAFEDCTGLTSVTIGNGVTSISFAPFYNCTGLTTITVAANNPNYSSDEFGVLYNKDKTELIQYPVGNARTAFTIPASVTSIGYHSFRNCISLTSVTIPNSVTNIRDSAFYYCTGLTSVTIPDSVTSIGERAFYGCTGLTSVTIGKSVTRIDSCAFSNCTKLTKIYFNAENASVPNGGLFSEAGTNGDGVIVTFGVSVQTIPANLFDSSFSSSNMNLKSVIISDSVTSIGGDAFLGCTSLTSVTIGNSVTSIGNWAFSHCTGLTSVTIPDSVTSIGHEAFSHCTGLTNVTIPDSVTSIGGDPFSRCTGLTTITVGANNLNYSSDEFGVLYNKDKTELIQYPVGNVRTTFTIPTSVTSIGGEAFRGCSGLTSVTIPISVTSISGNAFLNCGLKDVYYGGSESDRAKISILGYNNSLSPSTVTWHYNSIIPNPNDIVAPDGTIIQFSEEKYACSVDEEFTISGELYAPNGTNGITLQWSVTDENGVTINTPASMMNTDANHIVFSVLAKANLEGSYTVTVTTSSGASSTCTVTVAEKPIYTLTYKDGDNVLAVQQYHAGEEITEAALDFLPYTFYNWNPELPEFMPDHNLVVTAHKSAFARSKDGFSFTNIAKNFINYSTNEKRKYHVSSEAYLNMKDSLSMAFIDWIRWNGSCHGMSAMVSSFFSNRINSSSFGAETVGQLKAPIENTPLRDAINVLQIAQELSPQFYACKIGGQLQSQESKLKKIVELAQNIQKPGDFLPVIAIKIENLEGYSNHAVTICGIDPLLSSDTYHAIHIYDPNLETERTMRIARDYSWCQLLGLDTKIWWVVDDPNLLDINTFLKTPIKNKKAVAAKNNESADEYTLIIAKTSGLIQITNQNGQIAQIQNHEIVRDEIGIAGVFPLSDSDEFSQIGISNKKVENQKLTVTDLDSDSLTVIVCCSNSSMAADLVGQNYSVVFDSEGKVSVISDQKVSGMIGCSSLDTVNGTDYNTVKISDEALQNSEVSFVNGKIEFKNVDTDEAEIKLEGVNENGFVSASNTDGDLTFDETDGVIRVSPKIVYTISYNANGGTGAPASQNGSGAVTLSNTKPTRDGYTFKGWATSTTAATAQYQPGESFNLTSNVTLYAVWQKNETPSTKPMVKSVSVNDLTINFKSSAKLIPAVTADDGAEYTITYTSFNPNVAKVDANGNVTGMKRGSATVTVTVTDSYGNSVSDTCKVTVKYTVLQWIIKILLFGWIWYK